MYKRYNSYQDSVVAWLGEIPSHWDESTINALTRVVSRKNRPNEPLLSVYRDYGVILKSSRDDNYNRPGQDLSAYKYVKPTNLVLNKMKTWQGSLGVSELHGIVSPAYITCELNIPNVFPKYLHYLLRCRNYIHEYNRLSYGVRTNQWDMRYDDFKKIPVFLPSKQEQRAIANFLDYKTAEIDRFIANKEKLITLLNEQKAAVINRAITKGINPGVKLKSSRIEWLGEIPEHWEMKKIKHTLQQIIDTEHKTAPFHPDGEYLVVRTSNVRNGKLILEDAKYTDYNGFKEWTRRGIPNPGDILFTREAPAGEACIVPDNIPLCIGQRIVLFRVNKNRLDERYGVWSLYSGVAAEFIQSLSQGSTVAHFNMADIGNIPIFVPPIAEQHAIADYLDQETEKIDAAVAKAQKEIELIKKYRQALISEAVTGKINVRGQRN